MDKEGRKKSHWRTHKVCHIRTGKDIGLNQLG